MANNTSGGSNSAIGVAAGCLQTTGSDNIYVGSLGAAEEEGVIRIGNTTDTGVKNCKLTTAPVQTKTYIAGIYSNNISTASTVVHVTSDGQLGTVTSSQQFIEGIKSMGEVDERILKLRPVSFRYKQTSESQAQPLQYGLIAEEVAKILPEMVELDKDGTPFAVNYRFLTPLLLAMMQNEHKTVQQQQKLLMTLKEQNEALRKEMHALRKIATSNKKALLK